MVCAKLFHFLNNCVCNNITRLKLVREALAVFVEKNCTLAANTFADKKSSALFLAVKCCRVNLNVVYILKFDAVLKAESKAVAGDMRIICRVCKQSADAAGCKNNIVSKDCTPLAEFILADNAVAGVVVFDKINHRCLGDKSNIRSLLCDLQKGHCNLLAGFVLVVENTIFSVRTLARVVIFAVRAGIEINTEVNERVDYIVR